jgi:hypothetical protein
VPRPALALDLGDALHVRVDALAHGAHAPESGDPLPDGLPFARWLEHDARLGDDARAELLLARAALRRRGLFVAAARLHRPYPRLLVVARLPWGGPIHRSVPSRPGGEFRSCFRASSRARSARVSDLDF